MNIELQLKIAKEYWEDSEGNPESPIIEMSKERTAKENLAIEELLNKGVIKRGKHFNFISTQTKHFIDNHGKTNYELEKEKEEKRRIKELEIAKESNKIAKYSIGISIVSILVSTSVAIWVTLKG